MMTMSAVATAVGPGISVSTLASGGSSPYVYSVMPGGAGGTVNSATGIYVAPSPPPGSTYVNGVDNVVATDASGNTASISIIVGNALILLEDIIRTQMGLSQQQIWEWNQKQIIPNDQQLYIAVQAISPKAFGSSTTYPNTSPFSAVQSVNMMTNVQIDIFSRTTEAFDRKEEIVMAFNSVYAQQQMAANSFTVVRLPNSFVNLTELDGSAILYRYAISVNLFHCSTKTIVAPYFDTFSVSVAQIEP